MKRKILLLEPKYRNKYPPIGLMKIATYHRMLGDTVIFFKGNMKEFLLDQLFEACENKLSKIDDSITWTDYRAEITEFIRTRKQPLLDDLVGARKSKYQPLINKALNYYSDIYRKKDVAKYPKWDRIYVTTLFTFYWKVTVETIHFAKNLVKTPDQIMIGGVLASLLHAELEQETGIKAHKGLLDKPGILDPENKLAQKIIIDDLPLDYSILEEVDYEYPTGSAYFTFMTKGCTRKCAFCSVPILEPTYKQKIDTIDKFWEVKEKYGEQQHLLLMDNNVLASPKFPEIIDEIKSMGFYKGATYIEPNQLDIALNALKKNWNNKAYIKRAFKLHHTLLRKLKGATKQLYYDTLEKNGLLLLETTTRAGLLESYKTLKPLYEKHRSKAPRLRYVDFNQGTDARYVTDELMKLMSEIPIRPLRIAFDYWGMKDKYEAAVRLAAKHGLTELSNYILYNFNDSPEELYKRLEINVRMNEELGTKIFSFPMKYIPLFGEAAKNREHIGRKWNKKYIRAIQSVLNVTKGIVAPGARFFEKAFGNTLAQFNELLLMPEDYIVYRQFFETNGFTEDWRKQLNSLDVNERAIAEQIIKSNDFTNYDSVTGNAKILSLLKHYTVRRERLRGVRLKDLQYKETKRDFDKLIKTDNAINLTLTYDFEAETTSNKKRKKLQPATILQQ